ncbi:SRPBCC domain-containing protein [Flavimaricola marinus]|uniref:Activator of Hsp90 ATPase homologue 1/2-like C-terminal domain-containing protein n=1 Tax=Flavimaricola marinus TaxID=1819565 RepID=A0A238LAQ8_9RHOB|nr:SRPBCC domain-containing protein [Flavimaricola marinus]SMY05990.1 hypothetical protein LOM8899_00111 [Flavimaricola marinus]
MTTDTATFEMHRSFPLPQDRLWQALTDPSERCLWNAPMADMTATVETADLRVGGLETHHYSGSQSEEMPDFSVGTRWYQLDRPGRAVFTETVEIAGTPQFTSFVTYVLTPAGEATTLTISVATSSFAGPEFLDGLSQGWDSALDNLNNHIATLTSKANS